MISRDLIYACALSVLVSSIDLNFQEILSHELAAYPPVVIKDNGAICEYKNNKLKVEVSSGPEHLHSQ